MSHHAIHSAHRHLAWDNSIPPVLTIRSGDTVTFDCLDASNGQIHPGSRASDLRALVFADLDPVVGPVAVAGARPGDVLQVDVLALAPAGPRAWGWTAALPGFGLLADEFDAAGLSPALKLWDLSAGAGGKDGGHAWFDRARGIRVPLRPFCGAMGVARAAPGMWSTIPPYNTGGNIDTRHLTAGATLYLPVEVPGALFSCGDGHAAQGDGEVCGTALETPVRATLRLTVLKNRPHVRTPHFTTPPPSPEDAKERYYCTTGVEPSLEEAARAATRHMIAHLCAEHGLARVEAYMLCSVAGDLRVHEAVDMPNYVVGMMMPLSIFGHRT